MPSPQTSGEPSPPIHAPNIPSAPQVSVPAPHAPIHERVVPTQSSSSQSIFASQSLSLRSVQSASRVPPAQTQEPSLHTSSASQRRSQIPQFMTSVSALTQVSWHS